MNNPENTEAWIQLGHVYFDTNINDKAIVAYEKSLELNPRNANVLTDLGIMYRRNGQPQKAIEKFDEAIVVTLGTKCLESIKGSYWCTVWGIAKVLSNPGKNCLESIQLVTHYKEGHDKGNSN